MYLMQRKISLSQIEKARDESHPSISLVRDERQVEQVGGNMCLEKWSNLVLLSSDSQFPKFPNFLFLPDFFAV